MVPHLEYIGREIGFRRIRSCSACFSISPVKRKERSPGIHPAHHRGEVEVIILRHRPQDRQGHALSQG